MRWVRVLLVAFCALYLGLAPSAYANCSAPAAAEGVMLYNTDHDAPQYCDGSTWHFLAPPGGFTVGALNFNGNSTSGDFLTRDSKLDGTGDSNYLTFSVWWRAAANGQGQHLFGSDYIYMMLATDPALYLGVGESGGWQDCWMGGFVDGYDGNWHHIIASVDAANSANTRVYVDDVAQGCFFVDDTAATFEFSAQTNFFVGSGDAANTSDPWKNLQGDLAEVWIDLDSYIDFFVEANRRKFITENGRPADLGSDGRKPTGSPPDIFLSGDTANWHVNKGTGGGFTENGTLTTAATTPNTADMGDYTTGLVGHWSLNETTGTIAYDSAGSNDGTLQNGLSADNDAADGVRDGALEFDGSDDRITMGGVSSLEISLPITFSVWMYPETDTDGILVTNDRDVSGSYSGARMMVNAGGSIQVDYGDDGGCSSTYVRYGYTANGVFPLNQWSHVTGIFRSATDMDVYVNGVDVGPLTYGGTGGAIAYSGSSAPSIGNVTNCNTDVAFEGLLDDVRIYNRALTDTDVKALYMDSAKYCLNPDGVAGQIHHNLDTRAPMYCDGAHWVDMGQDSLSRGLVGHWKLDEAGGTTAYDATGNTNGSMNSGLSANTDAVAGMVGGGLECGLNADAKNIGVIDPPAIDLLDDTLTVSLWYKDTFDDPDTAALIFKTDWATAGWTVARGGGPDNTMIVIDTSGGVGQAKGTLTNVLDGEWHHIAYTLDNGVVRGYKDGALVADETYAHGTGFANTAPNLIICDLGGVYDDVRIYNRALSAAEVTALYKYGLQDDGLVAYWPLNEDGGAIANDMQGDNIGYASGGVVFSSGGGQIKGAATFDGVDDLIQIGDPADGSLDFGPGQDFSVAFWLKRAVPGAFYRLLAKSDIDGVYRGWGFYASGSDGGIRAKIGDGSSNLKDWGNITGNDTNWHHHVFTFDRDGVVSQYADGVYLGNSDISGWSATDLSNTNDFCIGTKHWGGTDCTNMFGALNGSLDDIRIYNRVLAAAEIAEIYTAGAAGFAARDCTNPNGAEGVIIYNLDENAPQYCDGARWVRMGGP